MSTTDTIAASTSHAIYSQNTRVCVLDASDIEADPVVKLLKAVVIIELILGVALAAIAVRASILRLRRIEREEQGKQAR
ncbi:MAG TPA: hypothetical protein VN380_18395 [Thermoanaerobaculia bacterium]|nr:hypothetical protein [Thermoanaerobaculia bacterium]